MLHSLTWDTGWYNTPTKSLTIPIKPGLRKLLNIKMQPEVWLVVVYWNS